MDVKTDPRNVYAACVIALTKNKCMKRRDLRRWINDRLGMDLAHLDLGVVDDRSLRKAVSYCIRKSIMPVILSSSDNKSGGYYLSSDPDVIKAAADQLKSRICVLAERYKHLMIAYRTRRGQLSLFP